ncbi:MAG: TIGR00730 family Rossman fold protein [Muribaculaceae bacterium]|nr:TIGR00730 family Rossman fold protein [Muribaculaceae bacterium]
MKTQESIGICVFAASSQQVPAAYIAAAQEFGRLLAVRGWRCVNGAGSQGLMRAVSDGALDHGGHVTGVIPRFMVDHGWCYDRLTDVVVTDTMHSRKHHMHSITQAVAALPGGCGTLEELMEALTWRQLGVIDKPIVLLNTGGFFAPLVAMLTRCLEQGFMKPTHAALWTLAGTPAEAVQAIARELQAEQPMIESKY